MAHRCWREFYPSTPPESLGFPGVGILVLTMRGHTLDPATLQRLLGPDWRNSLNETRGRVQTNGDPIGSGHERKPWQRKH